MVFSTPERPAPAKSSTAGLLRSVTALAVLCAKKASQVTKILKLKPTHDHPGHPSPRSPLARPMNKLKPISQSAKTLIHKKKTGRRDERAEEEEDQWGHGGVWQKGILMGDRCQPLDFSGAIYYDSYGNKMNEPPLRSPRASPLPGYLLRKTEA